MIDMLRISKSAAILGPNPAAFALAEPMEITIPASGLHDLNRQIADVPSLHRLTEAGMLVLTRKLGEVVFVGRDVEIMVVGVNSGKVRLGFRAPREVVIQRAEVAAHAEETASDAQVTRALQPHGNRDEYSTSPPLRSFRQLGSDIACS